jgi:IclR family transcriptional regulator, pca regulon regulatory protein
MSQNTRETGSGPEPADDQAQLAYVTAFGRGLAVIRTFSRSRPSLTIAEVARETGLNRATARRFLHTLEIDGYARCENGRYTLSPAILELGYSYLSTMSVDSVFQVQLHDLAEKLQESCSAGVLDNHDVVFVARAQTSFPRIMTLALSVGSRVPAYLTAIGRVLLAELDDDTLDEYLRTAVFLRETERTITDPDRLREVVMGVRGQGYCVMDQEIEAGVCAVSVPVHQPNRPTMGISVAVHASRTSVEAIERDYLPALLETAAGIERILSMRN